MSESFFDDDYEKAEPAFGDKYVKPGTYRVKIKQCVRRKSRANVPAFIAELEVLESNNEKFPVGSAMTWYQGVKMGTDQAKMAQGEIRRFIDLCFGEPTDKAVGESVISDAQPLAGTILRLIAIDRDTKAGKKFTSCEWALEKLSPVVERAKAA
jgi:hypothetical protein